MTEIITLKISKNQHTEKELHQYTYKVSLYYTGRGYWGYKKNVFYLASDYGMNYILFKNKVKEFNCHILGNEDNIIFCKTRESIRLFKEWIDTLNVSNKLAGKTTYKIEIKDIGEAFFYTAGTGDIMG